MAEYLLLPAFSFVYLGITGYFCWQASRYQRIPFVVALLVCLIIPPPVGFLLVMNRPLRQKLPCPHCGNPKNEVLTCGVCGGQVA